MIIISSKCTISFNIGVLVLIAISSSTIGSVSSQQESDHIPTICTHDGDFHADEVLACYFLRVLYPTAKIVRSQDPSVYETCEIVLDVGSIYDPRQYLYDHHQPGFSENMYSLSSAIKSSITLSSAGLIYHHFGRQALEKLSGETEKSAIDYLYRQLYYSLIQEIDGIDNGIPRYDETGEPVLYQVYSDFSRRIARLNRPLIGVAAGFNETAQFYKALAIAGQEVESNVKMILESKFPARKIVHDAITSRYSLHYSGQIMDLKQSCPWRGHFAELEKRYRIEPPILYVLFKEEETYRVQCVTSRGKQYGCRKPLPESWRGLQNEELSKEVGIEGCIFVHASGFTAGHKTHDGALQMAIKAIEEGE